MTRAERREQRRMDYLEDKQLSVYNHALGYVTARYVAQVRYTHRQRLAEHLHNKARRDNPLDTALLPWQ